MTISERARARRAGASAISGLALAALLATAGCGDSDGPAPLKPPHSEESAKQAMVRLAGEVERRRCRDLTAVFHRNNPFKTPEQCRKALGSLPALREAAVHQYGSGALALFPGKGALVLVLDRDARFKIAMAIVERKVGGRGPDKASDRTAKHVATVLRRGSCPAGDRVFQVQPGFCNLPTIRSLTADLRGRTVGVHSLGGEFDTAFYGVRGRAGHYYTLVFFAADIPGPVGEWQLADALPAQ
jgi:hypothetical protein